ncbi:MAG: TonB-dependent receptor [Tannerella sp.]|nr:TonB-dependent receptor [Tannerella sp.]
MKLTFILTLAGVMYAAASTYAQEHRVSVQVKNGTFYDVITQIEKQSEFMFFYKSEEINNDRQVSLVAKNKLVSEVLNELLKGQGLSYRILDRHIIITKSPVAPEQQTRQVTGTVVDVNDEPIIGATVIEKGSSSNGTVTDMDGKFALTVSDNATLRISFVGYISQEISVVGQIDFLTVTLLEDTRALDEIIVVGYGTQSKRFVSGSVSSLKMQEVSRDLPNTNVSQSLNSLPGIQFIGDGRPGQDGTVLIRGQNSLSGGNTPLIVLDGIIFSGSLSDINPQDIETIDILKDASSATVYGSRASNGVILITSKKGTTEKPTIRVNFFTAVSNPTHQLKLLTPERYIERRLDWRKQQGLEADIANIASYLSITEADNYKNGISHNSWDVISQHSSTNAVDVSVSANTKYITYYLSGSFNDERGLIYNDNQRRNTFRSNIGSRITDWFAIGMDATFSLRDMSGKEASVSDAYRASPFSTFYYEDGEPTHYSVEDEQAGTNPLYSALLTKNEEIYENLFSNFYADIDIPFIEGLNYTVNYSPNIRWGHNYNYVRQDQHLTNNMTNASKFNQREYNWVLENIVSYRKTVNDHSFDLTLLYSRSHSQFESTTANANQLNIDGLGWNALALGATLTNTSNAYITNGVSYMGRINYRFLNRYLATLTARRDGSSVFARNHKYATFPSASLAYIISEERFFKKISAINLLKLRVSYGSVGNQAISPYQSLSLSGMKNYVFGDGSSTSTGIVTSSLGNDDLKWETTTSRNVAIDFELFDNRLGGTIELYDSDTKDLLVRRAIPVMNGYTSIFSNIGQTNNRGIELSLHSVNMQIKDFRWLSDFSFTYNQNKIVHLYGEDLNSDGKEDDDIDNSWFVGKPINSYYDYVFDGIYQEGDTDIPAGQAPGFVRVKDLDNNGIIDSRDRTVVCSGGTPKYQIYLRNSFEYKNFSLAISLFSLLDWNAKFNLINPLVPGRSLGSIDAGWWTSENKSNDRPALNYSNPLKTSWYMSRDFVRIKDISLSYEFDSKFLHKTKLAGLRLFISGKNLLTLTKWPGLDPESGGDYIDEQGYELLYPMPRTYSVGLNIAF